ncbi:hypothetical protein V8D89_006709 [Ganoderma adspersum]
MSSDADSELSQLIDALQSSIVANQCGVATVVLYIYDFTITFPREVELFWGRRFTGASLLFLLNRYLNLAHVIVEICNFARMSDQLIVTCRVSSRTSFGHVIFSSMRAYALSRRHWVLSATILTLSLVPTGINYAEYRWLVPINDPIFGCGGDLTVSVSLAKHHVQNGSRAEDCRAQPDILESPAQRRVLLVLNMLHLTFTMLSIVHTSSPLSYITLFTEPCVPLLLPYPRGFRTAPSANQ